MIATAVRLTSFVRDLKSRQECVVRSERPPATLSEKAAHSPWGDQGLSKGGNVEFVMFEDADGMEVFVNPDRVMWVREYPNHTTVISCGHEDKFTVRLAPAHAVAALGKSIR